LRCLPPLLAPTGRVHGGLVSFLDRQAVGHKRLGRDLADVAVTPERQRGEPLRLRLWNLDVVVLADLDQVGRLVQLVEVDVIVEVPSREADASEDMAVRLPTRAASGS